MLFQHRAEIKDFTNKNKFYSKSESAIFLLFPPTLLDGKTAAGGFPVEYLTVVQ